MKIEVNLIRLFYITVKSLKGGYTKDRKDFVKLTKIDAMFCFCFFCMFFSNKNYRRQTQTHSRTSQALSHIGIKKFIYAYSSKFIEDRRLFFKTKF